MTFYLKSATDTTVFFVTYVEQGRENRQFRPVIRKETGTGTYEGPTKPSADYGLSLDDIDF